MTLITDQIAAIAARDLLLDKAVRRDKKYDQIVKYPVAVGISIGRDEYVGPQGVGYVDFCHIEKEGIVYRCQRHTGPERYRDALNDVWVTFDPEKL